MGLSLVAKGYEKDFDIGYIGYGLLMRSIASSYNVEFGEIFAKQYSYPFKEYTQEEIDRWNEICDDDLDILLNHSDCDGKLTYKECRKIIKSLDKIDFNSKILRNDTRLRYYELKDIIRYCAKNRKTLWFY